MASAEYSKVGAFLEAITQALAEADDPCSAETRQMLDDLPETRAFYDLLSKVGERARAAEQEVWRLGL